MKRKDIMLDPDEEKERVYEQINTLYLQGKHGEGERAQERLPCRDCGL